MTNKRMDLRLPVDLPARLETAHHRLSGQLENLSFRGACVRLTQNAAPLKPSSGASIRLEPAGPSVAIAASVVAMDPSRVRIVFGAYNLAADYYLTHVLEEALRRFRRQESARREIHR